MNGIDAINPFNKIAQTKLSGSGIGGGFGKQLVGGTSGGVGTPNNDMTMAGRMAQYNTVSPEYGDSGMYVNGGVAGKNLDFMC